MPLTTTLYCYILPQNSSCRVLTKCYNRSLISSSYRRRWQRSSLCIGAEKLFQTQFLLTVFSVALNRNVREIKCIVSFLSIIWLIFLGHSVLIASKLSAVLNVRVLQQFCSKHTRKKTIWMQENLDKVLQQYL